MPRKLKRRVGSEFTRGHRAYLAQPVAWPICQFYRSGELPARYRGEHRPEIRQELAAAWEHFRDEVMVDVAKRPFSRPWGYWTFDCEDQTRPNPDRPGGQSVVEWLIERPELLTDLEKRILADPARAKPNVVQHLSEPECRLLSVPFTPPPARPAGWWRRIGSDNP